MSTVTQIGGAETGRQIQALSRWIDNHPENASRDPEATLWGRTMKVAE